VATALERFFHFQGVATIGSAFGGIPVGLPSWHRPDWSLPRVIELIGPAFTITLLGAIESLLSAVVADGMAGTRHDPNQELIGLGLANLLAPLLGGFAATGAIARTATNVRNGATGPLAGVIHALTLVGVLFVLAPLAADRQVLLVHHQQAWLQQQRTANGQHLLLTARQCACQL
jgi:SulP family sulfate permease